ncbi:DUF5712 family protein [Zunongwangia sp.]|uniref:DUF5712 family protein n=1 Tax=Zunongwangia sp. TaxID=1965325 RepID=UPI003AA7EFB0
MYITITAQKAQGNYAQSAADFVEYLEKENEGKPLPELEHFFDQQHDEITAEEVIWEIDGTVCLVYVLPKFVLGSKEKFQLELQELNGNRKVLLKKRL